MSLTGILSAILLFIRPQWADRFSLVTLFVHAMIIPVIFHKAFVNSAAVISLLANGTLLLLLLHRTSQPLGNYKLLLLLFALTDIFISLFHAWYIPMFILGNNGYVFFGYGTIFKRGTIARNADLIYANVFFTPFCLLSLHFIYRYCSLVRPSLVTKQFYVFLIWGIIYIILYTFSVTGITSIGTEPGIPKRLRGLIAEFEKHSRGMEPNLRSLDYLEEDGVHINKMEIFIVFTASWIGGHTVIISILCIAKINRVFDNIILEINLRRLHMHLFRALIIQFTIPVIFSLIPMTAIFAVPATGIYMGQWGNIFALLSSVFPALDPILIILSIGRFRSTVVRWFDLMTGRTARRNEKRAEAVSKMHFSMLVKKPIRSL